MEVANKPHPAIRETVAAFASKESFRGAIAALLAAGFAPDDLSVLATHESLEIAGQVPGYPGTPRENVAASLTDEVSFLAPVTVAGIVLLSGGAVAAALAALVGAGLGGMALNEVIERYTANRHSADFAKALAAGAVLLWVRVGNPEREAAALRILEAAGGRNAHIHTRDPDAART
ncbi:MAG TPA: hypothetical protein VN832_04000 [Stellaceae bacterium]|nr:hypothetical protein [Stellaceae bacterium]